MARRAISIFAMTMLAAFAAAQTQTVIEEARTFRASHENRILAEFFQFLSIPNTAATRADLGRNAEALFRMMQARGIETQCFCRPGVPPLIFGELHAPQATKSIGFYAHYDGQPVVQPNWRHNPWQPLLIDSNGAIQSAVEAPFDPEWRIFARSTSDDKAAIVALMAALDALHAAGRSPNVNLKFLFD